MVAFRKSSWLRLVSRRVASEMLELPWAVFRFTFRLMLPTSLLQSWLPPAAVGTSPPPPPGPSWPGVEPGAFDGLSSLLSRRLTEPRTDGAPDADTVVLPAPTPRRGPCPAPLLRTLPPPITRPTLPPLLPLSLRTRLRKIAPPAVSRSSLLSRGVSTLWLRVFSTVIHSLSIFTYIWRRIVEVLSSFFLSFNFAIEITTFWSTSFHSTFPLKLSSGSSFLRGMYLLFKYLSCFTRMSFFFWNIAFSLQALSFAYDPPSLSLSLRSYYVMRELFILFKVDGNVTRIASWLHIVSFSELLIILLSWVMFLKYREERYDSKSLVIKQYWNS